MLCNVHLSSNSQDSNHNHSISMCQRFPYIKHYCSDIKTTDTWNIFVLYYYLFGWCRIHVKTVLFLLRVRKQTKKNLNFVVLFKFIHFSILAKILFAAETFVGPKGKHIPPLTIVQFLTIALCPSPLHSQTALNTHWGKLSMQCSLGELVAHPN